MLKLTMRKGKKLLLISILSCALLGNSAYASDQATTPSSSKTKLTEQQKSQIAAAQAAYKATAQQALDGANRAIADAKSLLEQAIAASGKDKNLIAMAKADYKKNAAEIWAAFKKTIADAKATRDAAIASIKG